MSRSPTSQQFSVGEPNQQISALFERYKSALVALASVGVLVVVAQILISGITPILALQLLAAGILSILLFLQNRLHTRAFVGGVYVCVIGFVVAGASNIGLAEPALFILIALVVTSTVIWGARAGLLTLGLVVVALAALASRFLVFAPVSFDLSYYLASPTRWILFLLAIAVTALWCILIVDLQRRYWISSLDKLKAEAELRSENEARLSQAAELAGLGYFVIDTKDDRISFSSELHAAQHDMTPEEYIRAASGLEGDMELTHPDDRDYVRESFRKVRNGLPVTMEYRILTKHGQVRSVREVLEPVFDEDGNVIREVGSSLDVTDLRRTEAVLRQAQKMEAIGNLTGGLAHDFNNLLAVILGNLELLQMDEKDPVRSRSIKDAIKATQKGAELTRNLLSFARQADLRPDVIDLNEIVSETGEWSNRVIPSNIAVATSLSAELWPIEADRNSTENAILNLLVNARDAMPSGGNLTIETANAPISESTEDAGGENLPPGRYVMLAVSDDGDGIAPALVERVREPFFTTKSEEQGSGLGLSMVDGFMKQSGGDLRIYSELGVGTTVKLFFPALSHGQIAIATVEKGASKETRETARILAVEDQEEVLTVLRRSLEAIGHEVISAASANEAARLFAEAGPFDLVITDIVMPGKTQGPSLVEHLRETEPDLPVIFISGYASEAVFSGNGIKGDDQRLMKPVGRRELIDAVNAALASRSSAGARA